MAVNNAEMDRIKEEMRFLNGRLDENSHLLKRSIERDTMEGDALVSELRKRMDRLALRVDRISSYLGLEPVIPSGEKDAATAPLAVPQVQTPVKPAPPEVQIPS